MVRGGFKGPPEVDVHRFVGRSHYQRGASGSFPMLWGSLAARIDEKFRLKIPAKFRRVLPETEDSEYFVTSDDGRRAQIYPKPVWRQITERLRQPPRMDPAKLKFQKFTNFYGIFAKMDPQGRILIPQALREDAQIVGNVVVMAEDDHLEVWNSEIIRNSLQEEPMTNADRERLAEHGI